MSSAGQPPSSFGLGDVGLFVVEFPLGQVRVVFDDRAAEGVMGKAAVLEVGEGVVEGGGYGGAGGGVGVGGF